MTNTMSCGCKIISDNLGAYKIEYCPKHKTAPDMYEALENIVERYGMGLKLYRWDINPARDALAKAGDKDV